MYTHLTAVAPKIRGNHAPARAVSEITYATWSSEHQNRTLLLQSALEISPTRSLLTHSHSPCPVSQVHQPASQRPPKGSAGSGAYSTAKCNAYGAGILGIGMGNRTIL